MGCDLCHERYRLPVRYSLFTALHRLLAASRMKSMSPPHLAPVCLSSCVHHSLRKAVNLAVQNCSPFRDLPARVKLLPPPPSHPLSFTVKTVKHTESWRGIYSTNSSISHLDSTMNILWDLLTYLSIPFSILFFVHFNVNCRHVHILLSRVPYLFGSLFFPLEMELT